MKQILFILLILSADLSNAQSGNKIVLGTIDSVYSGILGENRKVWIYVPNGEGSGIYSKQKYPVVYLLDGDAHFYSVVGMIHQLSSVNGNTICPQMIVVGIPNTDRTRDLTPTHVDVDPPFMDSSFSKNTGGGEKFISFMEKELMPHIDSVYSTQPYKMLIGHSFGGLTAINVLVHHPDLFNSYVAIDPSMWYGKRKLLNEAKQAFSKHDYSGKALFIGIANTMNPGMDTSKVKKDTSAFSAHIRSILELSKYAKLNKQNKLKFDYRYYKDDDHSSSVLISEYDALRHIFNFYPLKLTGDDYSNVNKSVVNKIENHYQTVSKEFGFTVNPPEEIINTFGYQAMNQKHFDEAEYLFKLNTANYSESSNTFDSLGDLYSAKGDKAKAIENYKKSLSLKEVAETRDKLKKLEEK